MQKKYRLEFNIRVKTRNGKNKQVKYVYLNC